MDERHSSFPAITRTPFGGGFLCVCGRRPHSSLCLLHMLKTFSMYAEKIAHNGAAVGSHEGKSVYVHGMLPGEEGVVEVQKKHRLYLGTLKELTHASPRRKNPEELHYLSCSPWQVMEYPLQAELKQGLLQELFHYYADAPKATFVPASQFYGYRTKIEFSFSDRAMSDRVVVDQEVLRPAGRMCDMEGEHTMPLSLAFHVRGGGSARIPLPKGCVLASEEMNRVALAITERLRALGHPASHLKTLVIRESKSSGKLLAMLYAKKEDLAKFSVDDISGLSGFFAFYSTERSPASVETKELWRWGEDMLFERVSGLDFGYSRDAFFQNNIPLFEKVMESIASCVPDDARVVELYAGVGTIGLCLAEKAASVHGGEIVPAATAAAKHNAEQNGITNYVGGCIPAEKMDARLLDGKDVLILAPPRSGLHPKVLAMIEEKRPQTIIYLSCNPETQARDYSQLSALYRIDKLTGFDFYPQTPHLESLLCLSLRG